jgi:hypothetical protein
MSLFERIALFISRKAPFLRDVYLSLPVIREINFNTQRLDQYNYIAKMQCLEAVKAGNPHFQDPRRLLRYGAQYWSQNFEDGMIEEIFRRISTTSRTFVEIGVEDGSQNNTTALLAAGWSGWWMEGDAPSCAKIDQALASMPSLRRRLTVKPALVSPLNINALFGDLQIPREVDLLSLDIDLDTYHIWAALENFSPRVVVVEYNGGISPSVAWISPWIPGRSWDRSQAFGASLKSFELLGRKKGYALVGCDLTGINAFFVREDLVNDHFCEPFTAENHYEVPRYYLTTRFGHRSVLFGESHDPKSNPYA